MLEEGKGLEAIMKFLRGLNYTKLQSVTVLVQLTGNPLNQLKSVVHESDTWSDFRDRDEEFLRDLDETLEEALLHFDTSE